MAYLFELTDTYYEQVPLAQKNVKFFGGIYWTHAYYPHIDVEFWRPDKIQEKPATIGSDFNIKRLAEVKNAFDCGVLQTPKKEKTEEFLVVRAKRRTVIMLIPKIDVPEKRSSMGIAVNRGLSLVAQVFTIEDEFGRSRIDADFLANIQSLKYPQFMFLPKKAGLSEQDAILRLDECQSVFTPHLEPTGYQLTEDLKILLKSQFRYFACQVDDKSDYGYIELMKLCNLP